MKRPQRSQQNHKALRRRLILSAIAALALLAIVMMQAQDSPYRPAQKEPAAPAVAAAPRLLSDPFLQLPRADSVQVVWFTEFKGVEHRVEYGQGQQVAATSRVLSRTREDSDSQVQGRAYPELTRREIWRHQATVSGIKPGERLPYRVVSRHANGQSAVSNVFSLAAAPPAGAALKILLTSDHQLMPMTPANLQKVQETVGPVDGVFFAGDLVNVPDRASEWFDDARGLAFFPVLQGRARYELDNGDQQALYTGAPIIQNAPLFPTIGNHEVMGRASVAGKLKAEFENTLPRSHLSRFYPAPGGGEPSQDWIKQHSFNSDTYEEIFSLPQTALPGGGSTGQYYAVTFGDVRLVSLYVTQIWRSPSLDPNTKGRYRERQADLQNPETWGYGQHIFADIRPGSPQHEWLKQELASEAFQQARYKIVMLHHPPHTLGGNIVPAFTEPVLIENLAPDGQRQSVQYEYPKDRDYLVQHLLPLLKQAQVDLVFYGHSHLWNRFVGEGGKPHFLETSNVGNSYGAHVEGSPRQVPTSEAVAAAGDLIPFSNQYRAVGDPNGLAPILPTLAPLKDGQGRALPYIASNDMTCFSVFETETGKISSYYFDTRLPDSQAVKFDEFTLSGQT